MLASRRTASVTVVQLVVWFVQDLIEVGVDQKIVVDMLQVGADVRAKH